jgi:hypothetical protein
MLVGMSDAPGPFPPPGQYDPTQQPAPPPQQWQAQGYGYGYGGGPQKTNGMATASMICGIVGLLLFTIILSPLALIFGFVSRNQIARSGGAQKGKGFSTAGIVLGIIGIALIVILIVAVSNGNGIVTN